MAEKRKIQKSRLGLNIDKLSRNGIEIHEKVAKASELAQITAVDCPQPELVAEGLLDWDAVLSESSFVLLAYQDVIHV